MDKRGVLTAAAALGFEVVDFQFNVARNTGRPFEVGYVHQDGHKVLFCKRQPSSSPDAFYLCNEFRAYEEELRGEDPR